MQLETAGAAPGAGTALVRGGRKPRARPAEGPVIEWAKQVVVEARDRRRPWDFFAHLESEYGLLVPSEISVRRLVVLARHVGLPRLPFAARDALSREPRLHELGSAQKRARGRSRGAHRAKRHKGVVV